MLVIAPACVGDPSKDPPLFSCHGSPQSFEVPDGKVVSALTLASTVHNVTVTARDLDQNREVTNTETYPVLDHGFALDLPFGHYAIEITDETNAMLARYPDVVVDGEVTLDAPSVAQRSSEVTVQGFGNLDHLDRL
jgi:hypothetical protein